MRYSKLKFYNYKAFYKVVEMDFEIQDIYRNVILIRGKNGYGKTSIITGIKLALYGIDSGVNKTVAYNQYLKECINDKALHEGERTSWVEIDFINDRDGEEEIVTVRREWTLVTDSEITESFYIFKDGREVELNDMEISKCDYLDKIIPKEVLNFFAFDAEEIRYTADDFNTGDSLTMDIAKILGLTIIEKTKDYLIGYIDKQKSCNSSTLDSKLMEENLRKQRLEESINEYEDRQKVFSSETEKLHREYIKKKNWLEEHGYSDITSRGASEDRIKELENKRDSILNFSEYMNQEDFAYLLLGPELNLLSNQLDEEELYARQENIKDNEAQIQERLILTIKGTSTQPKLTKRQIQDIEQGLKDELREIFSASLVKVNFLHRNSLTRDEFEMLQVDIRRIVDSYKEKLIRLRLETEEMEKIEYNIEQERRNLNRLPNVTQINEMEDEIKVMQIKLEDYEEKMEKLSKAITDTMEERDNERKQINKLCEQVKEKNKRLDKIQLCERVLSFLVEYTSLITGKKADEIIENLSSMFNRLAHKTDLIREFRIDSKTFEITMWDKYGNQLAKRRLSEGEKQIYGLSLTFALAKASDREFAFVIDTPFAKLDSEHKNNVIKEFIPNIGRQVIILAHDEEVNEERFQQLKGCIAKEYRILESEDNISFVEEKTIGE